MLVRKIEVANFKRLSGRVRIEGLADGINIIAGDNEEGKSTLLQAMKAAIFQKHNASSQAVKEFRPYNAAVRPEVTLEFDYANKHYIIRKGFCSKPFAEFRCDNFVAAGSEAEEKIREFFALNTGEKASRAAGEDPGIWGLLWLEQGAAARGLATSEGGRETLMRALDGDLSGMISGERGRALARQVAVLYLQDFTPGTGKEKGELKKLGEELEETRQKLEACRATYAQHQKKLELLSDRQEQKVNLEKEKSLEKARADMDGATADLNALERLRLEVDAAENAERAAELEWGAARKRFQDRKNLADKIQKGTQTLAQCGQDLLAAGTSLQKEEAAYSEAAEVHRQSAVALAESQNLLEEFRRAEELANLRQKERSLLELLQSVEETEKQLAELKIQANEIKIDEAVVKTLKKLFGEMESARLRSSAAATRLVLKPLPSHRAEVDGQIIDRQTNLSILKPTTIKLADWGELDLTPGGEETEIQAAAADKARRQYETALLQAGITSLAEAEDLLKKLDTIKLTTEVLSRELTRNQGGPDKAGLRQNLARLQAQVKAAESVPISPLLNPETEQSTLLAASQAARLAEQKAKAALDQSGESVGKARLLCQGLEARKSALSESLAGDQKQLDELLCESAEEQQVAVARTESLMAQAQAQTRAKKTEMLKLDETQLRKRFEDAKQKFASLNSTLTRLTGEIMTLSAEINAEGQSGLGEKLEILEGESEIAEKKCEARKKTAQALKLLHETLLAAQEEGKSQILLPVLGILRPRLAELFPGSDIVLDHSKIEIACLQRNGLEEPYLNLSMGTREQLSILTRLALAQFLKRRGQPCAVVLDDALVYSDEPRTVRVKEMLQELASEIQVLILTCRLKDYADIKSARVFDLADCLTDQAREPN